MANVPDAVTMSLLPPAISDNGNLIRGSLIIYRTGERLSGTQKAADELIVQANVILTAPMSILMDLVRNKPFPACRRGKSGNHGVSFDEINQTISVAAGSNYGNDYTNNGRVQQVIVQADAPYRMQPEQLFGFVC
ncbi:efflux RND transporter permease subunit [Klebsiella pneumoniae]|nr:efflux RND transporter permease subunit [Klebsiella pneumoniae]